MPRGRTAETPAGIPAQGWRDVLWRMWHGFDDDHVMLVAAGIAFCGLLALVPALAALVAIYTDSPLIRRKLSPRSVQFRMCCRVRPAAFCMTS